MGTLELWEADQEVEEGVVAFTAPQFIIIWIKTHKEPNLFLLSPIQRCLNSKPNSGSCYSISIMTTQKLKMQNFLKEKGKLRVWLVITVSMSSSLGKKREREVLFFLFDSCFLANVYWVLTPTCVESDLSQTRKINTTSLHSFPLSLSLSLSYLSFHVFIIAYHFVSFILWFIFKFLNFFFSIY